MASDNGTLEDDQQPVTILEQVHPQTGEPLIPSAAKALIDQATSGLSEEEKLKAISTFQPDLPEDVGVKSPEPPAAVATEEAPAGPAEPEGARTTEQQRLEELRETIRKYLSGEETDPVRLRGIALQQDVDTRDRTDAQILSELAQKHGVEIPPSATDTAPAGGEAPATTESLAEEATVDANQEDFVLIDGVQVPRAVVDGGKPAIDEYLRTNREEPETQEETIARLEQEKQQLLQQLELGQGAQAGAEVEQIQRVFNFHGEEVNGLIFPTEQEWINTGMEDKKKFLDMAVNTNVGQMDKRYANYILGHMDEEMENDPKLSTEIAAAALWKINHGGLPPDQQRALVTRCPEACQLVAERLGRLDSVQKLLSKHGLEAFSMGEFFRNTLKKSGPKAAQALLMLLLVLAGGGLTAAAGPTVVKGLVGMAR